MHTRLILRAPQIRHVRRSGRKSGRTCSLAGPAEEPPDRTRGCFGPGRRESRNPPCLFITHYFAATNSSICPRCNPVLKSMNAYGRPAAHIVVDRKRISSFSSIVRSGLNMEEASLFFPP